MNPHAGPVTKIVLGACLFAVWGSIVVGLLLPQFRTAGLFPLFTGFGLALALGPKASEEARAESARWRGSWSAEIAGERWLRRFMAEIGTEARHEDPDPFRYSPLAVQMVAWSLQTMPRPRRMRRQVAFWIERLVRYGPQREEAPELPTIRALSGMPDGSAR